MGLENSTDEASIGSMDLSLSGKVGLRSIVCYVSTTVADPKEDDCSVHSN